MSLLADATSVIERWTPPSAELRTLRGETLGLLRRDADAVWREGAPTHLTASAVVLDRDLKHVLLVHHAKSRRWQFPGGHCERTDPTLEAAARREVAEETGLDDLDMGGLLTLTPLAPPCAVRASGATWTPGSWR